MNGVKVSELAPRLMLACALVSALAWFFGRRLIDSILPVLATVLAWVADDFKILSLTVVQEGPDLALEARAMLDHVLVLGGRAIVPNGRTGFAVTTTLGTVLQPILAAMTVVLAWPATWLTLSLRMSLLGVLLVPTVLLDSPLYLAGSLWDMQVRAFEPGRASPLLWWMHFLAGGGRLALGLAVGAIATAVVADAYRGRVDVGVFGESGGKSPSA